MKWNGSTSGLSASGMGEDKPARAIDWSEAHHRLDQAQAAVQRGWTPTPEKQKAILRARAGALAREPNRERADAEYLDVVEFVLAQEKYGIEACYVSEVYPLKELTPLPCTPPFVLGIINVRGRLVSIINVKKFFDLPEKGLTDLNKVIIVRAEQMALGILADAVVGARPVPLKDLQPGLPTLTGIRAEYLRGVTNERLVVLDAAKILADRRMIVREQVES